MAHMVFPAKTFAHSRDVLYKQHGLNESRPFFIFLKAKRFDEEGDEGYHWHHIQEAIINGIFEELYESSSRVYEGPIKNGGSSLTVGVPVPWWWMPRKGPLFSG